MKFVISIDCFFNFTFVLNSYSKRIEKNNYFQKGLVISQGVIYETF